MPALLAAGYLTKRGGFETSELFQLCLDITWRLADVRTLLGYSGYTINEISSAADHAITTYKPNIILLHAGTNDLDRGGKEQDPIPGAPDRLGQLIDKCVSSNPDAAILVAQIINAEDGLTESNIQTFNKAIPGIVKQRADQGHHITVVDMTSINTGDLRDGLHPSDAGYRKSKSSSVG